jgi:hypothetical protein
MHFLIKSRSNIACYPRNLVLNRLDQYCHPIINYELDIVIDLFLIYLTLVYSYLFGRDVASALNPFICEISLEESYKVVQDERDFSEYDSVVFYYFGSK